jgi:hypothetical protein
MTDSGEATREPRPDHVFDGGDLDCGSGLILLIRENMLRVPESGVLELRSREPTVATELPPWCRMVGHEYLGASPADGVGGAAPGTTRHFVRRGSPNAAADDAKALDEDKQKAREYEWRLRVRSTGPLESTAYCRNFSFRIGQPASFEERDRNPSAIEVLLGALGASLTTGFATEASRDALTIDDIELTIRATLGNPLAHLGLGEGDPGLESVDVRCFASTSSNEDAVRAAWERAVARSPVAATLSKGVPLRLKLAIL